MEVMRIESLVLRHCSLERVCAVCTVVVRGCETRRKPSFARRRAPDFRAVLRPFALLPPPRQRPLTLRNQF
jgi:hypothetical protein